MKDVKIEFKVDDVNGIISLTNSDYFTAYHISTMDKVSKLVASKKSPYHEVFGRNGVYLLVEDDCKNPPRFYVGKARPFQSRFVSACLIALLWLPKSNAWFRAQNTVEHHNEP